MISFKGRHFEKGLVLLAVRRSVAYALSYRDIEELMAERGINVDHSTINRWVIKYAPLLEKEFSKRHKKRVNSSWRMDETYVKIKGKWYYLYRAVDKCGNTVDFFDLNSVTHMRLDFFSQKQFVVVGGLKQSQ